MIGARRARWRLTLAGCVLLGLLGCRSRSQDSFHDLVPGAAAATLPPTTAPAAVERLPVAPPPETQDDLVLLAAGDVNLGRAVGQKLLADAAYNPFAGIAPLLATADARFINLESPLSDQDGETQSPLKPLVFTGPPNGAALLARVGFNLVATANNHAWDYGRGGLFETMRHLSAARVPFAGTSRGHFGAAYAPRIVSLRGFEIALFAVTDVWNYGPFFQHEARRYVAWAATANLRDALQLARRKQDLVLVSYHGGDEYSEEPSLRTERFVQRMRRFGVDAVLGHHPHVIQGVRAIKGMPTFYSLGNLVFGTNLEKTGTDEGLVARLTFCRAHQPRVEICPVVIRDSEPSLARGELAARGEAILTRVSRKSGLALAVPDDLGCAVARFPNVKPDALTCPSAVRQAPAL